VLVCTTSGNKWSKLCVVYLRFYSTCCILAILKVINVFQTVSSAVSCSWLLLHCWCAVMSSLSNIWCHDDCRSFTLKWWQLVALWKRTVLYHGYHQVQIFITLSWDQKASSLSAACSRLVDTKSFVLCVQFVCYRSVAIQIWKLPRMSYCLGMVALMWLWWPGHEVVGWTDSSDSEVH